jgi:hypothetical protein
MVSRDHYFLRVRKCLQPIDGGLDVLPGAIVSHVTAMYEQIAIGH